MVAALAVILVIMAMIFTMAMVVRLWLPGLFVSVLWHACSALSALGLWYQIILSQGTDKRPLGITVVGPRLYAPLRRIGRGHCDSIGLAVMPNLRRVGF